MQLDALSVKDLDIFPKTVGANRNVHFAVKTILLMSVKIKIIRNAQAVVDLIQLDLRLSSICGKAQEIKEFSHQKKITYAEATKEMNLINNSENQTKQTLEKNL